MALEMKHDIDLSREVHLSKAADTVRPVRNRKPKRYARCYRTVSLSERWQADIACGVSVLRLRLTVLSADRDTWAVALDVERRVPQHEVVRGDMLPQEVCRCHTRRAEHLCVSERVLVDKNQLDCSARSAEATCQRTSSACLVEEKD